MKDFHLLSSRQLSWRTPHWVNSGCEQLQQIALGRDLLAFNAHFKRMSILLGSFGGRVVDAQHTSGLSAALGKSPGRQHEKSVGSIGSLD